MNKRRFLASMVLTLSCAFAFAQPEIQSQWNGARVAFLGDSITDPAQLAYANNTYPNFLHDILGIEPYNYGVNGHQMKQLIGQAERLEADHGQKLDAILVLLGTNDFNASTPLGEWYTYSKKTTNKDGVERELDHRDLVFCDSTFCGITNTALRYLKTHYPDKQIILMTPIHRGLANFGKTNYQPPEDYASLSGDYIDDFVQAIKEAGQIWSMPVIDLNGISGLLPTMDEQLGYFRNKEKDHLHPNTAGQHRMAYSIAYQLLGYPAKFPKYVALSFDDGPNMEFTPKMLDVLEANGVKASFFLIGRNVTRKSAPIMKRMLSLGCDIENHTYTHPDLTKISDEEMLKEVARADSAIFKWAGVTPTMVRPPFTDFNEHVAEVIADKVFIAGLSCQDWRAEMTAEEKIEKTLSRAKDGDILLFHDSNAKTVEAISKLIPEMQERGFVFVTVPELFEKVRGRMPESHEERMFSNVYVR